MKVVRIPSLSIDKVIVFFGFFTIFFGQLLNLYIPSLKLPLLLLFIIFAMSFILLNRKHIEIKALICVPLLCILIILGTFLGYNELTQNFTTMFFYIPVLLGLCFAINFTIFFKLLKIFILINLAAMVYEFITLSFIFEPMSDLAYFTGRAKGFISYSKEAGSLVLILALLFSQRLKYYWFPILLFSAFLSGSRLAILGVILIICFECCARIHLSNKVSLGKVIGGGGLLFFMFIAGYFYISSDQSSIIIERLYSSLDTNHSSNNERMNFWYHHLLSFGDNNILGFIFGEPGKSTALIGNGAESAFINLLSDGGLVALFIYLTAIFLLFWLMGPSIQTLVILILLILSMQISRVNIGFLDGTVFWAYFWYLLLSNLRSNHINYNPDMRKSIQ